MLTEDHVIVVWDSGSDLGSGAALLIFSFKNEKKCACRLAEFGVEKRELRVHLFLTVIVCLSLSFNLFLFLGVSLGICWRQKLLNLKVD